MKSNLSQNEGTELQSMQEVNLHEVSLNQNASLTQTIQLIFSLLKKIILILLIGIILLLLVNNQLRSTLENKDLTKERHTLNIVDIDVHNTADQLKGQIHEPNKNHKDHPYALLYVGVGAPNTDIYYNDTPVKKENLAAFDEAFLEIFKPYNNTDCDYARFGDPSEDSFVVCKNFLRFSDALMNFGIVGKDKFGCDISSEYPLINYQFDCVNPNKAFCATNSGANAFTSACLSDNSQTGTSKHTLLTLIDALKKKELTKKRVTIKLDVKGLQFHAFKHFPLEYLDFIDQIIVRWEMDGEPYAQWGHLDIFKGLASKFIPVNIHYDNSQCISSEARAFRKLKSKSVDVTLVNKRWLILFSETRSFKEHPLNSLNPKYPNCN